MTKKPAILIIIALLISALVLFFIFFKKNDSDSASNKTKKENIDQASINTGSIPSTSTNNSEFKNSSNEMTDQALSKQTDEKEEKYEISVSDCENDCSSYMGEKQEYCRQVCGLAKSLESAANCMDKSGLEKDYCLKDLALLKFDINLCNEIIDGGIKQTCQNRLTEEMMEK